MTLLLKDPDAILDYAIDWGAQYLATGDVLSASSWSVIPDEPGGVAILGSDFDAGNSSVKAAGGLPGRLYRLVNQWLVSCSDDDLALGDNLAAVGKEIIQFTTVTALGAGRFQLTGVRRGLEGTAVADHPEGEPFVLIERGALRPINLPAWLPGSPVQASTRDGRASCSLIARIEGRGPIRSKLKL